ncbi:MAG TPA: hypothetical protein VLA87_10625 [Gaiellaceae bacterium]|nr:hypothetical protein [Gaiellaceae bacterium]
MRRFAVVIMAMALMGVFAQEALAQNPHLKGRNPVSFTDNGLTLSATVSYAGLGNFDTLQVLTATGNTTSTCTNQGGNQAPGQNPAPVTLVGATPVEADDIKNGNVTISSTTDPPVTPVPGAPGCPNANWREDITDVSFSSATIRLFQDQTPADGEFGRWETLVLTVSCTFSPPTSDGAVPRSGFTCST